MSIHPHIRYLVYFLRHKWYVLVFGRRLRVPIRRLLVHDWSKFTPAEWGPYVDRFFAPPPAVFAVSVESAFARAFLHHVHVSAHHWQHWVCVGYNGAKPLPIPDTYIREMVVDWAAMGAGGQTGIVEWYKRERTNMIMDSDTRIAAERYIEELTGERLWTE